MMVQILQAESVSLRELTDFYGLQLNQAEDFFQEWQIVPELTDQEKQLLDQIKAGYLNLRNYPPCWKIP